jgi:Na+/proline symporter
LIGVVGGALAWRRHRIWGAVSGAAAGFGLWLLGWLYFTDNL